MGESLFHPRQESSVHMNLRGCLFGVGRFRDGVSVLHCRDHRCSPVKPASPPCSAVPEGVRGHQLCSAAERVAGSQALGCSRWLVLNHLLADSSLIPSWKRAAICAPRRWRWIELPDVQVAGTSSESRPEQAYSLPLGVQTAFSYPHLGSCRDWDCCPRGLVIMPLTTAALLSPPASKPSHAPQQHFPSLSALSINRCPQHVFPVCVADEITSGPVSLQTLKPVADRANPRMGVGMLAFSSDSYFLASRNGQCHTPRRGELLRAL